MNPSRERRLVAALSLVLGLVVLTGGANAEAAGGLLPTSIHGTNFLIKSQADLIFCIEAAAGTTEGRSLTVQGCTSADTQRWALPWYTTGLNQIVDSQGMCLNVRGHRADDGQILVVEGCRADRAEFFTYTSAGLLQSARGCLAISGAAANAPLKLATCDATKPTQRWVVSHPST